MISLIIPIYKVEQYLPRCIDSFLAQTYRDFEMILVDDGSPDRCGEISDEYAARDSRIRVIHKANGGLSDARNAGFEASCGEYITFIDSDDWVAHDFLEKQLDALVRTGSDICECGVLRTEGEIPAVRETSGTEELYPCEEALKLLMEDRVLHQHVWNKLYRRSCVQDVTFRVGKTHEDEFWTYRVFGNAEKVVKIPDELYYYFQRPGSIMGTGFSLRRLDALEAKQERQHYIEEKFPALRKTAERNLFGSCIYEGQMTLKWLSGDEKKQAMETIDTVRRECGKVDISGMKLSEKLWIRLAEVDFWGLCRLKNLLGKGI